MADREKVIKGLDEHTNLHKDCEDCPYNGQLFCQSVLIEDALKLLKEQQETISSFQGTIRKLNAALEEQAEIVRCKDCIYHHYTNDSAHIPYCELIDYGYGWKDDEFCSRGKRR